MLTGSICRIDRIARGVRPATVATMEAQKDNRRGGAAAVEQWKPFRDLRGRNERRANLA
jgi:hypothetical protein